MRRFSAVVALLVCLGMGSFAAAQQQEFYISEVVVEGGVTVNHLTGEQTSIYDASGNAGLLNQLIGHSRKGGEVVLAGFYTEAISFAFPPAFMKEARLRIAAEWDRSDLVATRALIDAGALSLSGLITHERPAADAAEAYETAFTDPACLKMILDWKGHA